MEGDMTDCYMKITMRYITTGMHLLTYHVSHPK